MSLLSSEITVFDFPFVFLQVSASSLQTPLTLCVKSSVCLILVV